MTIQKLFFLTFKPKIVVLGSRPYLGLLQIILNDPKFQVAAMIPNLSDSWKLCDSQNISDKNPQNLKIQVLES